jgi:hypothetical protein
MTYHLLVTRVTRWVSLVEQKLLTLPNHLSSLLVFSGVHVLPVVQLNVYVLSSVLQCPLRFPNKNDVWFVLNPILVFVWCLCSSNLYLFVFVPFLFIIIIIIILYYRNQARNNSDILKFYSME